MSKTSKTHKIPIEWHPGSLEFAAAIICILVAGFVISFAIIAHTPLKNFIPGYPNGEMKSKMIEDAIKIDSLERCLYRWELYTQNLRRVIDGKPAVKLDSIIKKVNKDLNSADRAFLVRTDSTLRADVMAEEKFEVSRAKRDLEVEGLHFFKPLNGTLSRRFDMAQHPYLDITAPEGSTVKSVLDGYVIYTGWTEANDWTIILQHQGGIISVYGHNQSILKKVGDKVSAGSSIAILGGIKDEVRGAHLHFELWQDGMPLDPAEYIYF